MPNTIETDQKTISSLLGHAGMDSAAVRAAHVMRPQHVEGVRSSRGREEGIPQPEPPFAPAPSHHFDAQGFGNALHARLKDSVAGYVMRLRQNGATIYTLEWNWAKTPSDGGEGWTPDVRMHVASCSKLITAIAMTKLLNDKQLSYDTPIVNYLPPYWTKGPNVDQITFRNLMTHTSGFNFGIDSSASDYEFMKLQVATGVTHRGQYSYQNMNFGLCRILISTLNGNVPSGWPSDNVLWDFLTIQSYVKYVQENLFTPAGISGPGLNHQANDALAYTFPVNGFGWNSGDLSTMSGGAGWHISPDELLDLMGTFRRAGTIMSPAQAQSMLDASFGIDVQTTTPLGTLYNMNGRWTYGKPPLDNTEQSLVYFLPQDMELVVLANSPIGASKAFFRDLVTGVYLANIKHIAYDAVWRPGTSAEVQFYGLKYADYQKHYDDLWKQNYRIYLLNAYEENGQRLHDAVWRPGTSAEVQFYGLKYADYQKHYDDL